MEWTPLFLSLQIAADVSGDLVGNNGTVAIVGEMPELRFQLGARDLVKMEDGQERADAAAEDKSRIAAAHEIETAAGFAASL